MLTVYVVSGCDSVSYPQGKRKTRKAVLKLVESISDLTCFGDNKEFT